MVYAIINLGGRQHMVSPGETIQIDGTIAPKNAEILLFSDGKKLVTSKADLKEVKLGFEVVGTGKTRKLKVGRFKSKSRYDKVNGYRGKFVSIRFNSIGTHSEEKPVKTEVSKKTIKKPVVKVVKKLVKKTKAK